MDEISPTDARTERHLRILQELAEIGMALARRLALEAGPDVALTFARIARAVRQTLALEAKLADARQQADAAIAKRHTEETLRRGARKRRQVSDIVEHAIEAETEGRERDDLLDDLYERLADPDDDAAFADTPIAELIARLCADLGVTPPQDVWDDADWGLAEAGTRPRGSPCATPDGDDPKPDDPCADPPDKPPPKPPWPSH